MYISIEGQVAFVVGTDSCLKSDLCNKTTKDTKARKRKVIPFAFQGVALLSLCLLVSMVSLGGAEVETTPISLISPEDGGTPRDPDKITVSKYNEFLIRASYEEGGASPLKHPVSRMNLLCKNDGDQDVKVTLHIDLSDDGRRTDFDNRPEAGMPERDFIFIRPPGKGWQQVNGNTKGWVLSVSFNAVPGETQVGLSPEYSYQDYLNFINALSGHAHLEKRILGRSDGGREHWQLTITDPSIDMSKKRTILWHAREHAYETFSSYAMEGLVRFLLSDEAAGYRQHYVFVIDPVVNVDGVYEGFEYRGGYDFPDPRGTASAQLAYETVDRLKPDYFVTWHNWIAPRDTNIVFYTDDKEGKPVSRAFLRFIQFYPSLRSFGHRWGNDEDPLRYNWSGRSLSLHNIHQYAMKQYGTKVWGWEMPWWNVGVQDAVEGGAQFAKAFLTTIGEIREGIVPESTENPDLQVSKWSMHEFTVRGQTGFENPFTKTMLVGQFTSPSGKIKRIDGFYDGENIWRLRFVPDEEGEWCYQLRGEGVEILQHGKINCSGTSGNGFIRIHPQNRLSFSKDDGTPFFPMGDTCYGLHDDSPITNDLRAAYLKTRREHHFNFVRMSVGHSHERAQRDSDFWAWGGTADQPDLDRFNPVFFRSLDTLFHRLRDCGMNVELILLNFYRLPFTDVAIWTPERERLWLHYLLSRYAAFDNVFLWTLANEYETHPDGEYRLDIPGDIDWVKETSRYIKKHDPYNHLVTVHPVVSSTAEGPSPRDSFEQPWQIGGFFGDESALDVLSQQTGQFGKETTWDENLNCWVGDDENLVRSLKADLRYGKPVLNTENGYEYQKNGSTERQQVHHPDKIRRTSWRIVCAGGYFAAGFHGSIGHSDIWNRIDAPNLYTFRVESEGADKHLRDLYQFFNALPYWKLRPLDDTVGDAVVLAEEEKVYVAFFPRGGELELELKGIGPMKQKWFNPRTGEFGNETTIQGGKTQKFVAPDEKDWTLLLTVTAPGSE